MSNSKELFEKAKTMIPGGVNSPVRAFRSVGLDPIFIKSGSGSKIYDVEGNEYIDYVCSWGPLILGHAHKEIVDILKETATSGTSFGAPTELEVLLAEKIISMVPSVEMVRLVNSGTEATMSAIRVARGFTGREKIIKFEGCYHGHGDSFLIKAGSGALTLGEPDSPGVPKELAAQTLTAQFNDLSSAEELFGKFSEEIAALIIEPVAGNMGVIPPDDGFLQGLRTLCDRYKSVLIFDEVMTGFRVHPGGAQALYGVMPDLTTMGKVIGGGMPVGAYGGKKEIMEKVAPSGPIYQAGTLSGNPLAVAAGLKTLEIISQPGFFENLNKKSNMLFNTTRELINDKGLPLSVNQVNSMGCLFFNENKVTSFKDATSSDTDKFSEFFRLMIENGIYIAPSQYEASFVSASHSIDDIEKTISTTSDILTNKIDF